MKPAREDVQIRFDFDVLSAKELEALIAVGAVKQTRQTEDGRVKEFALTQLGRQLLARAISAA